MRNFFGLPGKTWPNTGRLCIYVLPNEQVRAVATRYQDAVRAIAPNYGLGLQEPRFLHMTVQATNRYLDEVTDDELTVLTAELTQRLRGVRPFHHRIGPPLAGEYTAEFWVEPSQDQRWLHELVAPTRAAITAALGEDGLPPLERNVVPHMSAGYGAVDADGDSAELTSAFRTVRAPMVTMPVDTAHLVAVHQHPDKGQASWDPIAAIALGTDHESAQKPLQRNRQDDH